MKSILKKIALVLLVILVVMQFIRPAKNNHPVDASKQISALVNVPNNVNLILRKACYDCHSNNTIYPWYSNIQPVYFWLNHHINEGKDEINFDEFAGYRLRRQYKKMEEIIDQLNENEMPLSSYTIIHKNAILTNEEKTAITSWASLVMDSMKAKYPIDSLVKKK
jgi:hypothetical protein